MEATFTATYWVFFPLRNIDFSLPLAWDGTEWSLSESEHQASGCGAKVPMTLSANDLECLWWAPRAPSLTGMV